MFRALFFLLFAASISSSQAADLILDEECLNFTVYPVQYELTIKPSIYTNEHFNYHCDLVITVIANAPGITEIELDAYELEISDVNVFRHRINIIDRTTPFKYDNFIGKLYIYLSEPLSVYKLTKIQYQIKIVFKKIVKHDSLGVFAVKYDGGDSTPRYMILTRLSNNHAKFFFPCFDNNRFEAVFKFKVNTIPGENGMQFINSSLVIAEEQRRINQNNYVFIEYLPSPQVSLNEIGFVYSQFSRTSIRATNTNDTIVIWAPGPTLGYYRFILKFGQSMMNLIHEYANSNRRIIDGPINIVSVPSHLDTYETGSWNLWTNGDNRLAYVPELSSIRQLEKMTFDFTQQLSRVWLGNPGEHQRTNWKEEWFKEGVATYFAYYFLGKYHRNGPNNKSGWPYGFYGLEMRHRAMQVDWQHSTPALINFNTTLTVEIPSRYKELVTMKTASLLWMVENWIGTDKFHAALVKYINMKRGSYISLQNFLIHLDRETVECVNQFFNGVTSSRILESWMHHSGYPVISVEVFRDRSPNVIYLKQKQFTFYPDYHQETKYIIPISYVVQHNQNCFNCHQPRFTISTPFYSFGENLNGGWIILNRRASGYYRVNYDVETWKLIAKTLKDEHQSIDELNRAQIVNDVFALYTVGSLNYTLATEILDYLEKEQSYAVWESAIAGFELLKIEDARCNLTKALYAEWQQFMRKNIEPVYFMLIENLEQQSLTRLFRSNIITFACSMHFQPCLQRVQLMLAQTSGTSAGLDPDSRQACYYTVISNNRYTSSLISNLTRFEEEDKKIATHRMREESKLLYRLRPGKPVEYRVNPTPDTRLPIPTKLASPKQVPDASTAIQSSVACLLTAYLCLLVFSVLLK